MRAHCVPDDGAPLSRADALLAEARQQTLLARLALIEAIHAGNARRGHTLAHGTYGGASGGCRDAFLYVFPPAVSARALSASVCAP